MKFYIETFGCKVNSYESNYLKQSLIKSGFIYTSNLEDSQIVIINTCTVTNTADAKCKKYVRRIKREYPSTILVVMGCSVQNNFEEYANLDIDILIGNINKSKVPEYLKQFLKDHQKIQEHILKFKMVVIIFALIVLFLLCVVNVVVKIFKRLYLKLKV